MLWSLCVLSNLTHALCISDLFGSDLKSSPYSYISMSHVAINISWVEKIMFCLRNIWSSDTYDLWEKTCKTMGKVNQTERTGLTGRPDRSDRSAPKAEFFESSDRKFREPLYKFRQYVMLRLWVGTSEGYTVFSSCLACTMVKYLNTSSILKIFMCLWPSIRLSLSMFVIELKVHLVRNSKTLMH